MSSSEDKCEVFEDKHEDRGKMEYFCEAIKSTEGRKGKSKPSLGEYIRMSKLKMQEETILLLLELSELRNFRHYSRHVLFL